MVDAVGRGGSEEDVEAMFLAATDKSPSVRRSAMLALTRVPADVGKLIDLLAVEEDLTARGFGYIALARLGRAGGSPAKVEAGLTAALESERESDRRYAAVALGLFAGVGDRACRKRCADLFLEEWPRPKREPACLLALGLMGPEGAEKYAHRVCYIQQVSHIPIETRAAAAIAAGLLGLSPLISEHPETSEDCDGILGTGLGDAGMRGLVTLLQDKGAAGHVRSATAKAVGYLSDPNWADPVAGILLDDQRPPAVRAAAAAALGEILDDSPLSDLGEIAEDLNHRALVPTLKAFLDLL